MSDLISREQALKAIEEISYALWEIDIPSPTVPEYIEHHEGVQKVMDVADRWARKIMAMPSAEKTGKWILVDEAEPRRYGCPYCKRLSYTMDNYCSYCGARLVEE